MPGPPKGLTTNQLLNAAREVARRFPDAYLVKNSVGNLAVFVGGEYHGYVDLATGEVEADG